MTTHLLLRRAFSAWLTALLLMVSVVVPMLDGGEFSHEAAFESEHSAASCLRGHDHTICTQVSANLLLPAPSVGGDGPHLVRESGRSTLVFAPFLDRRIDGRRSRAPPRV